MRPDLDIYIASNPLWSLGGGCSSLGSSPADEDTRLIADENDPLPIGRRTPLILIHGIHGNQQPDGSDNIAHLNRDYFRDLLCYLDNEAFKAKYKIYRFHYVSDRYSVAEIGRALRNDLDDLIITDPSFDTDFMIVAHSMGGLVARSYMQENCHNAGVYRGRRAGERIIKLITLATPHHGAPGANDQSRNELATNDSWRRVLSLASLFYWKKHELLGIPVDQIPYNAPNRSDLLWDNFDNMVNPNNQDINQWLVGLNSEEGYNSKIIAYYGYLDLFDRRRTELILHGNISLESPGSLVLEAFRYETLGDLHGKLFVADVALDYGMRHIYLFNDGLVPRESAAFNGHSLNKRVECRGFDHLDLKEAGAKLCANGSMLFESLSRDLEVIPFDAWLQDENRGTLLLFSSATGDYKFCSGILTLTGQGRVTKKGSLITLQQGARETDRRIMANIDNAQRKGVAVVQLLSSTTYTITDSDATNNTCSCLQH